MTLLSQISTAKESLKLFELLTFSDVQVEEVTVKHGLYNAGYDSDEVVVAFSVVTVDPVEQVECPIGAEGEQVV